MIAGTFFKGRFFRKAGKIVLPSKQKGRVRNHPYPAFRCVTGLPVCLNIVGSVPQI